MAHTPEDTPGNFVDTTQLVFDAEVQFSDFLDEIQHKLDEVYKNLENAEKEGSKPETVDSLNSALYRLQEQISSSLGTHEQRRMYLRGRVPDPTLDSLVKGDELIKLQLRKLSLGREKVNNIVKRLQCSKEMNIYTLDEVCHEYSPSNPGGLYG